MPEVTGCVLVSNVGGSVAHSCITGNDAWSEESTTRMYCLSDIVIMAQKPRVSVCEVKFNYEFIKRVYDKQHTQNLLSRHHVDNSTVMLCISTHNQLGRGGHVHHVALLFSIGHIDFSYP